MCRTEEETDMTQPTVSSVDIQSGLVQLTDGQVIPFTNYLLGQDEVAAWQPFDRVVRGPDADGNWHATLLTEDEVNE